MADDSEKGKQLSPPYTAFQSIKTLIGTLKENGVPGRIDRSLLNNFSGQVASQLLTALRFLRLTDDQGHPTTALEMLVDASGTDDWGAALESVVRDAYAPLFTLNLATASPQQFNDAFRREYSAEGDTFRKCVTFFINAAREAKIPISAYIMQNKKPRLQSPTKKRASKAPAASKVAEEERQPPPPEHPRKEHAPAKTPEQVLLDILDPSRMTTEEQGAVFALLLYLKKSASAQNKGGDHQ